MTHHSLGVGGFIIRDWTSGLVKAGATHYDNTSILAVEVRVMMIQAGFTNILIECDKTVIQALKGKIQAP